MVKVRLMATLKERFGKETIVLEAQTLLDVLRKLAETAPDLLDPVGRPSPLYLYLINGADSRILGDNPQLGEEDEIAIIPINHGG